MALYLGTGEKVKIYLDNNVYKVNIFSTIPIVNGVLLLSSDDYILKDSKGLYLTAKSDDDA